MFLSTDLVWALLQMSGVCSRSAFSTDVSRGSRVSLTGSSSLQQSKEPRDAYPSLTESLAVIFDQSMLSG